MVPVSIDSGSEPDVFVSESGDYVKPDQGNALYDANLLVLIK